MRNIKNTEVWRGNPCKKYADIEITKDTKKKSTHEFS